MLLFKVLSCFLPWPLKRFILTRFFNFAIHPTARIGLSWIFPAHLSMEEHSRIEHFTVAIHLDKVQLKANASIGRGNWITGFSTRKPSLHFAHQFDRKAELQLGESAAVTKFHHLDCTNLIQIGSFATLAGYRSQLLTHSINVLENRQDSAPISIGAFTFVGTNVVILGGSSLPDYSVLGAKSLLNKPFSEPFTLYGGVPAKPLQVLPQEAKYFHRTTGFVY